MKIGNEIIGINELTIEFLYDLNFQEFQITSTYHTFFSCLQGNLAKKSPE